MTEFNIQLNDEAVLGIAYDTRFVKIAVFIYIAITIAALSFYLYNIVHNYLTLIAS